MALLGVFLQAFVVGLSGAMMPGPLLTYNIQSAFKRGFWSGPLLVLGHAILEIGLIVGICFGLGYYIQLPAVKITMGLIGGLLLAWMGYELIWKESRKTTPAGIELAAAAETKAEAGLTDLHPVTAGILISLGNPYWSLWWATIGLSFITKSFAWGLTGIISFFIGHILADLGWYSFISGVVASGKRFISAAIFRWLLLICGIVMILLAVLFIYDAVKMAGILV